ncbi:MAG TPA: hypothetical protein PLQ57_03550 [Saprospiraceae bacterium]|nr:hypothetical protein [Saprospiraceae bacterium]
MASSVMSCSAAFLLACSLRMASLIRSALDSPGVLVIGGAVILGLAEVSTDLATGGAGAGDSFGVGLSKAEGLLKTSSL